MLAWLLLTKFVSCAATRVMGSIKRKKNTDSTAKPFAARMTTPWSQANIASSYKRVTRSQRAVEYPATKIPIVTMENACIYTFKLSEPLEEFRVGSVSETVAPRPLDIDVFGG